MTSNPIRARRMKATRIFNTKVALLLVVMTVIAWAAWFAPWARTHHPASVEISR